MTRITRRLGLCACGTWSLFSIAGCAWVTRQFQAPEYSFGFYNDMGVGLDDTCIDWGPSGRRHTECAGVLSTHALKSFSDEPRPIPKIFVASWKTADGVAHRQVLERPAMANEAKFHGTIWFDFTDSGVRLIANTYDEQDRLADQGKPYWR